MSSPTNANPCCSSAVTTQVPGSQGNPGTNGTNGVNSFSTTQANFVVPAISGVVSVTVDNNSWMVVGQPVFCFGAGFFVVSSLSGTTVAALTYQNWSGNTFSGNTISSGAQISPGGVQGTVANPLPIANGGTGAATKAAAQAALGIGQNATISTVTGLTQDLTVTPTLIAGCTVTVPATGLYLVLSTAEVQYQGATFGSSEAIALTVYDTTTTSSVVTTSRVTGIMTTATLPSQQISTPYKAVTLTAGDVLQLQVSVAVIASAGHAYAVSASMVLVPLALS